MANKDIVYLTGSSGFLGGSMIVKTYRSKNRITGEDHVDSLFGNAEGNAEKCRWIILGEPIPQDVPLLMLRALNVKSFNAVEQAVH